MQNIIMLLKSTVYIYILFGLVIYLIQRNILYRPDANKPQIPARYADTIKTVTITTDDGLQLMSWYTKARSNQPTIIYFHGNAGTIADRLPNLIPFLNLGYGLLLLSYRGYADNPGNPTEQGVYQDARAAFKFLHQQNINNKDIIIFGESLGTGVAIQMANEYPTNYIILQSPYTSITAIAQKRFPLFPIKLMLKDQFKSIDKLTHLTQKLIIIHGLQDNTIPFEHGQKIFEQYPGKKEILLIPTAGHNDVLSYSVILDILTHLNGNDS